MSRFEECKRHALAHADFLIERIRKKAMRASAFETVMLNFLQQPGYDQTFRRELMDTCMTRFDGKQR